jgi:hypothetical protein
MFENLVCLPFQHHLAHTMPASSPVAGRTLLAVDVIYFDYEGKRTPREFDISSLTQALSSGVQPDARALEQIRNTWQKAFAQVLPAQVQRSGRFRVERAGEWVCVERESAYDTLFWDDVCHSLVQPGKQPQCIQWDENGDAFWKLTAEMNTAVCTSLLSDCEMRVYWC